MPNKKVYDEVEKDILKCLGGKENIISLLLNR